MAKAITGLKKIVGHKLQSEIFFSSAESLNGQEEVNLSNEDEFLRVLNIYFFRK
jgi:hypothetical protein